MHAHASPPNETANQTYTPGGACKSAPNTAAGTVDRVRLSRVTGVIFFDRDDDFFDTNITRYEPSLETAKSIIGRLEVVLTILVV